MAVQTDDNELIEAARAGDRYALDQLLRRYYDRIHATARRIAGPTRDGDDATQEALIKIVRSLPKFDGRSSFGTWAYRIATNAALDELRKRKRRPALHVLSDEADTPGSDPVDEMAERRVSSVADRLALDDALDTLPEEFRSAVVLRDVVDLDYAEIAEVLDIPIGTVKSRIARGRRMLADDLRLDEHADLVDEATSETSRPVGNRTGDFERPTDLT
ncbi:RNA polymerase sigma factor [Ilumatobacter nonamiensis]|uniref:RNA polymerase sigma factor n=1 Tax=Ilumatobacter nonamiensis TaxID=467093 RepID=UPI000A021420|nr:sigma-70 family RNA polymerase sigma factor [Ilumatobacter nonamiensis]